MKFKLEIDMGNEAMSTRADLARVLARLGDVLTGVSDGTFPASWDGQTFPIKDTNGNTVGRWTVETNPVLAFRISEERAFNGCPGDEHSCECLTVGGCYEKNAD